MSEYDLTEQQVMALRGRGLPFLRVNARTRLYGRESTVAWLLGLATVEKSKRKDAGDD